MAETGFTTDSTWLGSFRGALVCRFLLGFSEAVFYPGALFILSTWYICIYQSLLRQHLTIHWSRYKCNEIGLRTAYLFGGAAISTSLGYLVESSILATMDGKLGYAAWRSGTRDKLIVKLIITILQVAVFHRRRYDMFNCTNRLLHGPRFPHHACIVADS